MNQRASLDCRIASLGNLPLHVHPTVPKMAKVVVSMTSHLTRSTETPYHHTAAAVGHWFIVSPWNRFGRQTTPTGYSSANSCLQPTAHDSCSVVSEHLTQDFIHHTLQQSHVYLGYSCLSKFSQSAVKSRLL